MLSRLSKMSIQFSQRCPYNSALSGALVTMFILVKYRSPSWSPLRGPPLHIGGGGLEFLPGHFYFVEREMESFIFHLRIDLFPSCLVAI